MKTGGTSTMKKALFHYARFALFLYRLKWVIFNRHLLSETYIITKEFHMILYEHGIVNQKLRPHDSML